MATLLYIQGCKKSSNFLTPEFYDSNLISARAGLERLDKEIWSNDLCIQINNSLFMERHSSWIFKMVRNYGSRQNSSPLRPFASGDFPAIPVGCATHINGWAIHYTGCTSHNAGWVIHNTGFATHNMLNENKANSVLLQYCYCNCLRELSLATSWG